MVSVPLTLWIAPPAAELNVTLPPFSVTLEIVTLVGMTKLVETPMKGGITVLDIKDARKLPSINDRVGGSVAGNRQGIRDFHLAE